MCPALIKHTHRNTRDPDDFALMAVHFIFDLSKLMLSIICLEALRTFQRHTFFYTKRATLRIVTVLL